MWLIRHIQAWLASLPSLDTGWLFVLVLPLVVGVVAIWSRSVKSDRNDRQYR